MDGQSDVDSREEPDEVQPMSKSRGRGRGRRGRGPAKPQTVPPTRPRSSKATSEEESVNVPTLEGSSNLQQEASRQDSQESVNIPTLEGSSNLQQEASRQDSPVHESRETRRKPGITPKDMFTAVFSAKTAMVTVVDEWLDSYKQDQEEGLRVLINFMVKCCGCQGVVTKRMLDNKDKGYATIISSLTKSIVEVSPLSYPLSSTDAKGKRFNENLCEFVTGLVRSCENNLLYDDNLFSVLLPLLTSLSDSQVRAFRHTSTLLVMKLMTGIVDASVKVSARLQTITRHLENETNKPVQEQDFTRLENLHNTITQLTDNLAELTSMTSSTFTGVFVNRYCDTVPEIRAICLKELGTWVMHNPGCFLCDQYLKYIGWFLSDQAGSVRLQCVRILQDLFQKKDFIRHLEMFTSRFKERILVMTLDLELDVGVEIMKLLLLLQKQTEEGLTDTDCVHLYHMVFAKNRRLGAGAGTIIYNIWKERADQDDTMVFFQLLVTFYIKSGHSGAPLSLPPSDDELGSYLVDSLWGVPELRDWNTMTSLLLDQEPGLQYEEEGALIELMICAIRRAAEAKPPGGKKVLNKTDKENQVRDRMRITNHFIPVLPQLLAKFSADAKYVSRLLNIPLYFNLETYSTNGQLDRLLEPVCDIVMKHTETSVLDACTSLFSSLCSEQYTFNARSKTAISCLLDNLTDRFNPLVCNVLKGTADEDELYGAATALTKMAGLSRSFNITRLQLLEPCIQLLKKGVMSADMNKQLMVAALHTAASHLFWIRSPAVMEPLQDVKRAVKSFYKVSERCLSHDHAEIRNKAFEVLCDLLVLYSGYVVQKDPKMLSCSCPESLEREMAGFLVDFIFTDPEDDEHADDSEELKLAERKRNQLAVERKRNQLAGYCKLILFGVLDIKAAADVFKYYDKFFIDFGDIIKLFLNQSKLIDPVESAKTVGLCLQQLFTELNPTENTGKEFNEVKQVAKRHAMSLGVNLQPIQEQVLALHKQGIAFAFHDIQVWKAGTSVEGRTQPPKLLFLEILSEFSSKVLRTNRNRIIGTLLLTHAKLSKTALSWPSVKMYSDTLDTSISSPGQTKGKRPTIPEPASPGSEPGAPRSASGPPRSASGPPRSASGPPGSASGPPGSASGPPRSASGPPRSASGPPRSASGPPRSASGPPGSASGPPRSASGPPGSASGPPRSASGAPGSASAAPGSASAAPGSAFGSEGSVTFPSMENVDGSEGGAYSSPLPSNLGEPDLSSTVVHTEPTQLLGLDKEDGNIFEPPESDESKMRNVPQRPQHDSNLKSNAVADISWLSLIEEEEEEELMYEDSEESNNTDSGNM